MLSNGSMLVGLNKDGLVHDFYYPYVGLDNLTTTRSERHKIGIWVDGNFSWLNDGSWEKSIEFQSDALISNLTLKHSGMGIELHFRDFVDPAANAFCRHIKIINNHGDARHIRLFMHQVFEISRSGRADTALYEPEGNYILDYKGRCSLLVYAETTDDKTPFDQYAVGNYAIEGKEGTFRDAEDGELSGNSVEHGGVDSVIRVSVAVPANQSREVDYWVVAAGSQQDAEKVHKRLKDQGLESRLRDCEEWWHEWFKSGEAKLGQIDAAYLKDVKRSLLVIKSHIDRRGSILASGDSSIFNYGRDYYCYCWPRDGSYAIWPLIRLGFTTEARNFFDFCRDIIHEDGYMMHKYQPDRSIGSTWHPLVHGNRRELAIQEDETAIVIVMLGEYLKYTGDKDYVELLYSTLIKPAANFMASFIDDATNLPHASYDLWEEKFQTTTYSVATVFAALEIAAHFADLFGFADDAAAWTAAAKRIESGMHLLFDNTRQAFSKGILLQQNGEVTRDATLDVSSMYGMFMFGPSSMQPNVISTCAQIEHSLMDQSPSGGAPRYEQDWYMRKNTDYTGNPWFVCSLWMAQYYVDKDNTSRANEIMHWTMSKTLPSGVLSEQVDPADSSQIGVAPLIWSHAEFINTALDISDI